MRKLILTLTALASLRMAHYAEESNAAPAPDSAYSQDINVIAKDLQVR